MDGMWAQVWYSFDTAAQSGINLRYFVSFMDEMLRWKYGFQSLAFKQATAAIHRPPYHK